VKGENENDEFRRYDTSYLRLTNWYERLMAGQEDGAFNVLRSGNGA
jgi:hypothetical protein